MFARYTFSYSTGQTLVSPLNGQSMGSTAWLNQVNVTAIGTYHQLTFDTSGELTKVLLPYKGYLSYDYTTATNSSGLSGLSPNGVSAGRAPFRLAENGTGFVPGSLVPGYNRVTLLNPVPGGGNLKALFLSLPPPRPPLRRLG